MPRQERLVLPGVALHIVQRGNNRADCFGCESDRLVYLAHLRELSARHGCAVHVYCLMTNHVHLLLTPEDTEGCSTLMRDLGQRYVQYFNRRHERSGTLWEGRFRSCLVESARYALACHRYIESNPVRAGLSNHPDAYPWSSFRSNAGVHSDPMLSPHPEYLALGERAEARHDAYRGLFEQPLDPSLVKEIRDATNAGYPLASDALKARVEQTLGCKLGRGKPGPRPKGPAVEEDPFTLEIGL
ncbi:MAG TPA: transposase [Burkholderiales bacterium]|jgi:putative transposase|nr:transposase [Burkholderiales bacterium]